jgi:TolA-binding protein
MKKKTNYFVIIIVLLCLTQCAYYNIFYNAKQHYKKAQNETKKNRTGKVGNSEKNSYQKAIEKASKMIEEYPTSKYVYDAHSMIGRSYYYQQEYLKTIRKFLDIQKMYDDIKIKAEAYLWLAKAQMELELFEDAEVSLNEVVNQEVSNKLLGEAYYFLGKLYEKKKDFQNAVQTYSNAIEKGLGELKAEALFAVASNYDSLGIYEESAKSFKDVLKNNPTPELRFEANFGYAQALKKLNQLDKAIRLFESLLGDERNTAYAAKLKLEVAECLELRNEIDGAILSYQDIIEEFQRSKREQAAEAGYKLGKIYESFIDYDRALDIYLEAQKMGGKSVYADSIKMKVNDIEMFQALDEVIEMASLGKEGGLMLFGEDDEEDSLTFDSFYSILENISKDSVSLKYKLLIKLGGKIFADSIFREIDIRKNESADEARARVLNQEILPGVKWCIWVMRGEMPTDNELHEELKLIEHRLKKLEKMQNIRDATKAFKVEELDKNRFLLAELYLFHFSQPDSAFYQYQRLLSDSSESPYAPRALFNMGYILRTIYNDSIASDTCYQRLITMYPESPLVNSARKALNISSVKLNEDIIEELFIEAEKILLEQNEPYKAFEKYRSIWEQFPDSKWAPKAAYSMGWLSENRLDSLKLASAIYDSLMQQYPESIYIDRIKPKLTALIKENERKEREMEAQKKADMDSDDTSTADVSEDELESPKDTSGSEPEGELLPDDTSTTALSEDELKSPKDTSGSEPEGELLPDDTSTAALSEDELKSPKDTSGSEPEGEVLPDDTSATALPEGELESSKDISGSETEGEVLPDDTSTTDASEGELKSPKDTSGSKLEGEVLPDDTSTTDNVEIIKNVKIDTLKE